MPPKPVSLRDFHVQTGGLVDELPRGPHVHGPGREQTSHRSSTDEPPQAQQAHASNGSGDTHTSTAAHGTAVSGSPARALGDEDNLVAHAQHSGVSLRPEQRRAQSGNSPLVGESTVAHAGAVGARVAESAGSAGGDLVFGVSRGSSQHHRAGPGGADVADAHGLHRRQRSDDAAVANFSPGQQRSGGGLGRGANGGGGAQHSLHAAGTLVSGVGALSVSAGASPPMMVLRRPGTEATQASWTHETHGGLHGAAAPPPPPVPLAAPPPGIPPPSPLPGEPALPPTWPPPSGQLKLNPQQLADLLELKAAKIQAQAVAAQAAAQEAKAAAQAVAGDGGHLTHPPPAAQWSTNTSVPAGASPSWTASPSAHPAVALAPPPPPMPPPASLLASKPAAPRSALVDPLPAATAPAAPVTVPIAVSGHPAGGGVGASTPSSSGQAVTTTAPSGGYASVTAGAHPGSSSASSDRHHGRFTALLGPGGGAQAHHHHTASPVVKTSIAGAQQTAASAASALGVHASSAATQAAPHGGGQAVAASSSVFHTVCVRAPVVEAITSGGGAATAVLGNSGPTQAPRPSGTPPNGPPLPPGPPPPGQPRVPVAVPPAETMQQHVDASAANNSAPAALLPRSVTAIGGVMTPALVPTLGRGHTSGHAGTRVRSGSATASDDGHAARALAAQYRPQAPPGPPASTASVGGADAHGPDSSAVAQADPDGWRTVETKGVAAKRRVSVGRAESYQWVEPAVPWLGTAVAPAWQQQQQSAASTPANGQHASGGGKQ